MDDFKCRRLRKQESWNFIVPLLNPLQQKVLFHLLIIKVQGAGKKSLNSTDMSERSSAVQCRFSDSRANRKTSSTCMQLTDLACPVHLLS